MPQVKSLVLCMIVLTICTSQSTLQAQSLEQRLDQASAHMREDLHEEAYKILLQAVEAYPKDPRPLVMIGDVLAGSGEAFLAISFYTKALHFSEDFAPALQKRAALLTLNGSTEEALEDCNKLLEIDRNAPEHWHLRAYVRFERGEYELARADLEQAISKDPDYATAHALKGTVLLAMDSATESLPSFNTALRLDPSAHHYAGLARAQFMLKNVSEAMSLVEKGLKLEPHSTEHLALKSEILYEQGRYTEALKLIDLRISIDSNSPNAFYSRGIIHDVLGVHQQAIEDMQRYIIMSRDPGALVMLGDIYLKIGEQDSALQSYELSLRLLPTQTEAYLRRASYYKKSGKIYQALADLTEAQKHDPSDPEICMELGDLQSDLREYLTAIRQYDQAESLGLRSARLYNNRGVSKKKLGDIQGGIEDYQKAFELEADPMYLDNIASARYAMGDIPGSMRDYERAVAISMNGDPANHLADIYMWTGDPKSALKYYDLAIKSSPEEAYHYFERAIAYQHLKDTAKASADLDKAIALDPKYYQAIFERGQLRYYLGEIPGSLQDLTTAIEVDPDDPDGYLWRGYVKLHSEDHASALRDFLQATRLGNAGPQVHTYLGICYQALGDTKSAARSFGNAILRDSTHEAAYHHLSEILAKEGLHTERIMLLDAAIRRNPTSSSYARRGWSKMILRDYNEAVIDFERALVASPIDVTARKGKLLSDLMRGSVAIACESLRAMYRDNVKGAEAMIERYCGSPARTPDYEEVSQMLDTLELQP